MNIFVLDESPYLSAQWQHDRHVVKMILESAQMLSAALHSRPEWLAMLPTHYQERLYKPTHINHPCTIWARSDKANFVWLFAHMDGLISEYHRRFRKVHKTDVIRTMLYHVVTKMADTDRMWIRDGFRKLIVNPAIESLYQSHTPFAICMADEYKSDEGAISSYRTLYLESKIFQDHVWWTRCQNLPNFLYQLALSERVTARLESLYHEHIERRERNWLSLEEWDKLQRSQNHPDRFKPKNPKALTRFGSKPKTHAEYVESLSPQEQADHLQRLADGAREDWLNDSK